MAGEALGTATLILDADDRLLTTKLDGIQKKAAQAGSGIQDALSAGIGTALPGQLGQVTSALTSGTGGMIALGVAAAATATKAVTAANDFERLTKQMQNLTGSAEQTQAVIANLRKFAIDSPFELPELTQVAKQLISYGLSAREATDLTTRLGDVSAVTGGSLSLLAENLARAISANKVGTIDISQFSNAGLAVKELDKAFVQLYGKTFKELQAASGSAFIPVDKLIQAIIVATSEGGKYYQGAIKGATELDASWSSLADTFTTSLVPLGKQLLPGIVSVIKDLTILTEGWGKATEGITTAYAKLPGVFKNIGQAVQDNPALNPAGAIFNAAVDLAKSNAKPAGPPPAVKDTQADIDRAEEKRRKDRADAARDEIKNQEKIAEARSKANDAVIEASNRVAESERLLGLEGNALKIAEARLEIDKARAAEAKAITDYDAALKKAAFNTSSPDVIKAAGQLTVAGLNFENATLKGAQAVKDAARATEDATRSANEAINASENRLTEAKALLGLEGEAKAIAEARFKVEQAITAEAKARTEYEIALRDAQGDQTEPKVIEAAGALIAAGNDVETSLVEGARVSADALKNATRDFKNAEVSVFRLLTDKRQGEILEEKITKIREALSKGSFDLAKVAGDLGTALDFASGTGTLRFAFADPEKILSLSKELEGFGDAADKLAETQNQASIGLSRSLNDLANKDWQIYINVQGQDAVVQGAMLGGVN